MKWAVFSYIFILIQSKNESIANTVCIDYVSMWSGSQVIACFWFLLRTNKTSTGGLGSVHILP